MAQHTAKVIQIKIISTAFFIAIQQKRLQQVLTLSYFLRLYGSLEKNLGPKYLNEPWSNFFLGLLIKKLLFCLKIMYRVKQINYFGQHQML